MSAMQPLCFQMGINPTFLSKEEHYLLEAELFARVCHAFVEWQHHEAKHFAKLFKTKKTEEDMVAGEFVGRIVNDILRTNEYTLAGIACYTNTHEDVVLDVIEGINQYPSVDFCRRVIELHRSVRKELYDALFQKIKSECFAAETDLSLQ